MSVMAVDEFLLAAHSDSWYLSPLGFVYLLFSVIWPVTAPAHPDHPLTCPAHLWAAILCPLGVWGCRRSNPRRNGRRRPIRGRARSRLVSAHLWRRRRIASSDRSSTRPRPQPAPRQLRAICNRET